MSGRTRTVQWLLAGACLLGAMHGGAGAADTRKQFGGWGTVCSGTTYCTASQRIRVREAGQPYAFQLRVSRFESADRLELAFLSARERPAADEAIAVRIDGREIATLAPGSGYRAVAGGGTYVISDQAESDRIVAGMRAGKRVELSFRSAAGNPVLAAFPLNGFARALNEIAGGRPLAQLLTAAPGQSTPTASARAAQPAPASTQGESVASELPPAPAPAPPTHRNATAAAPAGTPGSVAAAPSAAPRTLPAPQLDPPPRETQVARRDTGPPPPGRRRVKAVTQFSCRGNEPFWNLIVDGNSARYVRLSEQGEPETVALTGRLRVTGEGRTPDVDWRGKAAGGGSYRAYIEQQRCLDSMSDQEGFNRFDYRVRVTLPGGAAVQGCCSAGLELPRASSEPDLDAAPMADLRRRPDGDWSRFLLDWHPAIAACLAKTPGNSAYVTKAWAMSDDAIGVRTRNSTVGWFECVALRDGSEVVRIGPVDSGAAPVSGEERVVYTPPAQLPPMGNCYTHERVLDVDGNLLGWLSDNRC